MYSCLLTFLSQFVYDILWLLNSSFNYQYMDFLQTVESESLLKPILCAEEFPGKSMFVFLKQKFCLWSHARHTYTIASCFWLRCGVEQFQQIFFLNMKIFRLFASFFHLPMIIGTNPKYSLPEDATRLSYIFIIIIIMAIICRRM